MREVIARNDPIFLLDDVCALIALGFFIFSLYIFPPLFWGTNYSVPDFVILAPQWLQDHYDLTRLQVQFIVFIPFFALSIAFFMLSKLLTTYLDIKYPDAPEETSINKTIERQSVTLDQFGGLAYVQIMVLLVSIISIYFSAHYLLSYFNSST